MRGWRAGILSKEMMFTSYWQWKTYPTLILHKTNQSQPQVSVTFAHSSGVRMMASALSEMATPSAGVPQGKTGGTWGKGVKREAPGETPLSSPLLPLLPCSPWCWSSPLSVSTVPGRSIVKSQVHIQQIRLWKINMHCEEELSNVAGKWELLHHGFTYNALQLRHSSINGSSP